MQVRDRDDRSSGSHRREDVEEGRKTVADNKWKSERERERKGKGKNNRKGGCECGKEERCPCRC